MGYAIGAARDNSPLGATGTTKCSPRASNLISRKRYCAECLQEHFLESSEEIVANKKVWLCPSKRQICYCEKCEKKEGQISLYAKCNASIDEFINKYYNGDLEKNKADTEQQSKLLNTLISELVPTPTPMQLNCLNDDLIKFLKESIERHVINKHLVGTQSVLNYNYYALNEYLSKKNELTKPEKDHTLLILWKNLTHCAKYFDFMSSKGNIINNMALNGLNSQYKAKMLNIKKSLEKKAEAKKEKKLVEILPNYDIIIYTNNL